MNCFECGCECGSKFMVKTRLKTKIWFCSKSHQVKNRKMLKRVGIFV